MDSISAEPDVYSAENFESSSTEAIESRIIDWLKEENIVMTSSADKMQSFFQEKREKILNIRRKSAGSEVKQGALNDYAKRKSLFLKIF